MVVLGTANSHPVPGLHGKALAVTLALCVFAVTLVVALGDGFPERSVELQVIAIAVLGLNLLGDGLRDLLDPRLAGRR